MVRVVSLLLVMFKIIEIRLKLVISFAVGSIGDMTGKRGKLGVCVRRAGRGEY